MTAVRGAVWTGDAWIDDGVVVIGDGGAIAEVRAPRAGDPPAGDGLILPGLVNAHAHLELSGPLVPGGRGLPAWVAASMAETPVDRLGGAAEAARTAVALGTAALCDVSNGGDTGPVLVAAGLRGIVQHELLGFDRSALPGRIAVAARPDVRLDGPVWVRPAPHAPYSTPSELIAAAARPGAVPASIHLAEDPAELQFLGDGTGPWAAVLDRLGRDWRWWTPPGASGVRLLDDLGLLGPGLLLVHGVWLSHDDIARIGVSRAPVCLCPRSNLHVGRRLADAPALIAAGAPLAIGTDSLRSAPDLDLLAEIAVLRDAWPDLPGEVWLRAVTGGGADALRLGGVGRLVPGTRPGVLWLDGVRRPEDVHRAESRRWLAAP